MPTISIQLYTLREALEADRTGTLAAVAAMGVDEVEPFGIENFDWLPAALAEAGLKAGSAHAGILQRPEDVLAAAKALGVTTVFQPSPPIRTSFETAEGIQAFAAALNGVVDMFAAEGIAIGYHNHEFEFLGAEVDGLNSYDYFVSLLDDRVHLELDTYWAQVGGVDVVGLLDKYGDKITHLHVKDGPVTDARDHANVVLGTGEMDIPTILSASPNRTWVLEFDRADINPIDESAQSIAYLRSHL
jgi:sugar phosphate isomerase/epimerase